MFRIRKSISDMDVPAHRLARLADAANSLKPLPGGSVAAQWSGSAGATASSSFANRLLIQEPIATALLANALFKRQAFAEAETVYRRLVSATIDDQSMLAGHLTELAGTLVAQNKLDEAREVLRNSVHAIMRSDQSRLKVAAKYLNLLADIYVKECRYSAAELLFVQTLEVRQKYLPWDKESLVDVLRDYALMLRSLDRFDEAEKLEMRAFELQLQRGTG